MNATSLLLFLGLWSTEKLFKDCDVIDGCKVVSLYTDTLKISPQVGFFCECNGVLSFCDRRPFFSLFYGNGSYFGIDYRLRAVTEAHNETDMESILSNDGINYYHNGENFMWKFNNNFKFFYDLNKKFLNSSEDVVRRNAQEMDKFYGQTETIKVYPPNIDVHESLLFETFDSKFEWTDEPKVSNEKCPSTPLHRFESMETDDYIFKTNEKIKIASLSENINLANNIYVNVVLFVASLMVGLMVAVDFVE